MNTGNLRRLAAFAETPSGGNPAGVWIGEVMPDDRAMQKMAKDVGYSETAFVAPLEGSERTVRYFSPEAEVSFCGHATIATGAALGSEGGDTTYRLKTGIGVVPITVRSHNGRADISLTSVDTEHRLATSTLRDEALNILGWQESELDNSIPPAVAYAGAWHLVLAATDKSRLANLNYDFEALKALMLRENLTTLQLVWRASDELYYSRNPFPVGGVVEDPATGAAAAAFAGYLRDAKIVDALINFKIRQGEFMGRPSLLKIAVPVRGGIVVTGTAVEIVPEA